MPQDPFLFDTTIRENIRWAKSDANDVEIEKALKLANAFEFVMSLPLKLETKVGLRGLEISGGQSREIRALIRKPAMLVLDEATSSIDKFSANLIVNSLKKISKETTLIIST